jgi:hypothetical protein
MSALSTDPDQKVKLKAPLIPKQRYTISSATTLHLASHVNELARCIHQLKLTYQCVTIWLSIVCVLLLRPMDMLREQARLRERLLGDIQEIERSALALTDS